VQATAPYCSHLLFGEAGQRHLSVVSHSSHEADEHISDVVAAESKPSEFGAKCALQLACARAMKCVQWAIVEARKHGYATVGLACVAYRVLYLLHITPYSSPSLHLIGARLVRDDGSGRVRFRLLPSFLSCLCIAMLFS
jgi:hypothetical protein